MSLQAALNAASRGWHVFPCKAGDKAPRDRWKWAQWNTTDPALIRQWWAAGGNVGIATGPSGLVVVDLDVDPGKPVPPPFAGLDCADGHDVFTTLVHASGESWPDTRMVRTPRGGWHLYFQAGDHGIRNSAGQLGPLIDIRGDGGFVVAAGSVRADGAYEVLDDMDPAPLPGWLATAILSIRAEPERAVASARPSGDRENRAAYLRKAIESEAAAVAATSASSHRRNTQLNKSAWALARFVESGELDAGEYTDIMLTAARQCGLPETEARKTIASALKGRRG